MHHATIQRRPPPIQFGKPPQGYSTVPEWWFMNEQEAAYLLDDPNKTWLEDADALEALSTKRGVTFYHTGNVRAFRNDLLLEFYPQNP